MNKNLKILLPILLISNFLFGQKSTTYRNYDGGFCGHTIVLFKDGTYNSETGCCSTSHFCFGKWTQVKDIIQFKPVDLTKFKVIKKVVASHINNDKLTVKIFDNQGKNITDKIAVMQFIEKMQAYDLVSDSAMTKTTKLKATNGILILRSLQNLFKQKIRVQTDNSNYYEIWLNISSDWIYSSDSEWDEHGNFELIKTKEGLVFPDEIGKQKRSIFKIQQ